MTRTCRIPLLAVALLFVHDRGHAFLLPTRLQLQRRQHPFHAASSAADGSSDTAASLLQQAADLRAEATVLEAEASLTRVPTPAKEKAVPYPQTLLDSCWRISMLIKGKEAERASTAPLRLSFNCKVCVRAT